MSKSLILITSGALSVAAVCIPIAVIHHGQGGYLSERQGYSDGCKQTNSSIDPDRVNPHWTPVGRSNAPVEIRNAVVAGAGLTHTDFPLDHNSHDFCFKLYSDKIPNVISDANDNYGELDEDEKREGALQPKVIECEWESAEFPETFWPQVEDEALLVVGRHVWDCGHPPLRTEIHPPQTVAFARPENHLMSGSASPSWGKRVLVYVHGGGGVFSANSGKQKYEFDFEVPLYGLVSEFKKKIADVDFKVEFELTNGGPAPIITIDTVKEPNKALVHVTIPLDGVDDPSGSMRYGLVIHAGWQEKVPSLTFEKLRYTIDTISVFEDHDPGLRGDGEWKLWAYLAGQYLKLSGLEDVGDDGEKGYSHWVNKSADVIVQHRSVVPLSNITNLRNVPEELAIWPAPVNRIRTTGWEDDCDEFFGIKKFGNDDASKFLGAAFDIADVVGTAVLSENDRLGVATDFKQDAEGNAPSPGQKLLQQVLGGNSYRSIKPFGHGEEEADEDTAGDFSLNFRVELVQKYGPGASNALTTLVIDKVIMHRTPQSGTWLFAFDMTSPTRARFHIKDREYEHDPTDILMRIALPGVAPGSSCAFRVTLDDDEDDVGTDDAEDKATGSFTATPYGQQTFTKGDDWKFTVYWHMEE